MIIIPITDVSNTPYFSVQIELDGTTYTLEVRLNTRLNQLFMDVFDESGEVMYAAGLALLGGALISAELVGRPWPGFFYMIDTTKSGIDATLDNIGDVVQLAYVEAADIGG